MSKDQWSGDGEGELKEKAEKVIELSAIPVPLDSSSKVMPARFVITACPEKVLMGAALVLKHLLIALICLILCW